MSKKPINLGDDGVRAVLDGRKTQHRVPVKLHRDTVWCKWTYRRVQDSSVCEHLRAEGVSSLESNAVCLDGIRCPFGQPGDVLWVREAWSISSRSSGFYGPPTPAKCPPAELVWYRADNTRPTWAQYDTKGSWRSPIHMPRWASRLSLLVTSVRVERVQDAGEDEADAMGIPEGDWSHVDSQRRRELREWWDARWAKSWLGWDANPWVWVVEFAVTGKGATS